MPASHAKQRLTAVKDSVNDAIKSFPRVVFALSFFLFIFFVCSLASIDQCDKTCTSTNHDLNGFNYFTTVTGFLMSITICLYSGYIIRKQKLGYY